MSELSPTPETTKRRAFHPPLLALAPVLLVYAPNAGLLPANSLLRPLLVAVGVVLSVWLLISGLFRSWVRGATFTSLLLALACGYSTFSPHLPSNEPATRQAMYIVLALVIAGLGAWKIRDPRPLNAFAVALLGLSTFQAVQAYRTHQGTESGQAARGGDQGIDRPDVYYIILDGFGRQDTLRAKEGMDDAFFVDGLRNMGFYVADRSRANYVQTELSLASSLNMEHLSTLLPNTPRESDDRSRFDRLIRENAVAKTFQTRGYRFVTVTTGFPAIAFPARDSAFTPTGGLSLLESAVLDLTPLGDREDYTGTQFVARQNWLRGAFAALDALGGDSGQPKFVFAHILAPHPPFVFAADGTPVRPKGSFTYYDASDWVGAYGTRADYQAGYRGQATWIARQTLATVRRLIGASRRPPILVVQGDHGPKSGLSQNSLNDTDLDECVPNLNAYYVPPKIRARLDPGITPVNSFRIILGTLFGVDLPRRPDTSYFSPFAKPMQLTDVTARVH